MNLRFIAISILMLIDVCLCEDACKLGACWRKCCPKNMFLKDHVCRETKMDFDDDFSAIGVSSKARIQDGIVECNTETEERFVLEKSDNFSVNEHNQLVYPAMNLFVNYTQYCVDMIENFTAPQALFCAQRAKEEPKTHHWTGKVEY